MNLLRHLDTLRSDLRLTLRTLRRNPGFTLVAVLSLALAIGANTAIFGLVDAVMLRLLPVRDPAGLVFIETAGTAGRDGPPYPFFETVRDRTRSFESVAAFSPSNMELDTDRGRELVHGLWVSGNFYETLGVRPVLGRALAASDDQILGVGGASGAVAVISNAFWHERFGGDHAVIGRSVQLFEHSVTIVGVMPSEVMSLEPGSAIDIAAPMMLSSPAMMRDRTSLWLDIVARLRPGVSLPQARAECNALFQPYMADAPVSSEIRVMLYQRIELSPAGQGSRGLRSQFSGPLAALMILAGLVLAAACVNLTNLMLARATARQKEFAVRLAIGAGRARLIRQTLTEALVIVVAGAALGVFVAQTSESALAAFFSAGASHIVLDLSLNLRILCFTAGIALLSGLALGIVPALRAAAADPAHGLQGTSRGVAGSRTSARLGRALVVVQVALSAVLLAGAGLFLRSLRELRSVDPGFRRDALLLMEVTPERQRLGTPQWLAEQAEVLGRVRRIPGVRSASLASMNPMTGRDRGAVVEVPGFHPRMETDKHIHLAAVSSDYFSTLAVPLLLGRAFTARDIQNSPKAAILNETAARFYFGDASPLGRTLRFTNYADSNLVYEIVGVVRDSLHDSLREAPSRFVYVPILQSLDRINRLALTVRCSGDAMAFAAPVRKTIRESDSTLLITNVSTMERQVEQTLFRERLVAALSVAFGCVALALACIGLYGVLAYNVSRRTHEFGIRMAVGATSGSILWLVLRDALKLAALGIAIALPIILALGGITRALLFGITADDPFVLAAAAALLLACAAIAAAGPSRSAASLDPAIALRRD